MDVAECRPADPLACVNRGASAHPVLIEAGAFSVNLLDNSQTETVAIYSARRGLEGDDRFLAGDWSEVPAGQPIFRRAVASFECAITDMHEHDTHSILIGRVVDVRFGASGGALLYLDGRFADAIPHPAREA